MNFREGIGGVHGHIEIEIWKVEGGISWSIVIRNGMDTILRLEGRCGCFGKV